MAITTKTKEEITNEIILKLISNGLITDYNIGSVTRTIIESLADSIAVDGDVDSLYVQIQNIYNGTRIETSTGVDLESLGLLLGIIRSSGEYSTGLVTFYRNADLTVDTVISAGAIIATPPNETDGQKKFFTTADSTFYSSIANESHKFMSGIYYYPLNSRFFTTIATIEATVSSSQVFLNAITDYVIESYNDYYIDTAQSIVVIDDFDATTGWAQNEAWTITLDSSSKKQGTNAMNLYKGSTSNNYVYVSKTISSKNILSKNPAIYINIKDQTALDKITSIDLYLCNTNITNSVQYTLSKAELSIGWKMFYPTTSITNGVPNLSSIDYVRIKVNTLNSSSTFTAGDIKLDYFIFNATQFIEGNIIRLTDAGTKPDNNTNFLTTYNPRSVDILCQADTIGTSYNVVKGKITNKITSNPSMNIITSVYNYEAFTSGLDLETDDALRNRILDASTSIGKATAVSLKAAIEAISGIRSATVYDLPFKETNDETHIYVTGTLTYKLGNEVAFLDNSVTPTNIKISNTNGGAANYTYGTDYTLVDSSIVFTVGGTKPSNGATFYVSYDSNWLGHCEIIVAGNSILTTTITADVNTAIAATKPAGVTVTWSEPTDVAVNVSSTITFATGYSLTTAKSEEIQIAISNYINSLAIGDDVIKNSIIAAIMAIEGVINCTPSTPAADVTIAYNEIAKVGVITLT